MTTQQNASSGGVGSPVDDRTYNILQALTSTLESIDAYQIYASEGDDALFTSLVDTQRRNADQLLEALRSSLSAQRR